MRIRYWSSDVCSSDLCATERKNSRAAQIGACWRKRQRALVGTKRIERAALLAIGIAERGVRIRLRRRILDEQLALSHCSRIGEVSQDHFLADAEHPPHRPPKHGRAHGRERGSTSVKIPGA